MQDDRAARYRQAALAARERAATASDPKLWFEIANFWEELASIRSYIDQTTAAGARLMSRIGSHTLDE
jgi:hypothetical protein